MTADLTDVETAQSVILRELRDAEAPVPLVFFDDILDRRLFTVALNRLARSGVVDIANGHISTSRPRLFGAPALTPEQPPLPEPATVTVPVALLERLTRALEKAEQTPVPVPPPSLEPQPAPPVLVPVPNLPTGTAVPTVESVARRVCVVLYTYGATSKGRLKKGHLSKPQQRLLPAAVNYALDKGAISYSADTMKLALEDPTAIGMTWVELDAERARLQRPGRPKPPLTTGSSIVSRCRPVPIPEPAADAPAVDRALYCIVEYLTDHPGHHSSWLTYHALPSPLKTYATAALKLGLARGLIVTDGPDRKGVPYRLAPKPGAMPEPEPPTPTTKRHLTVLDPEFPHPPPRSPVTAGGRSHGKTMERVAAAVLSVLSHADADEMTEAHICQQLPKRDRPWVPRVMLLLINRGEVQRTGKGFRAGTSTRTSDRDERIGR